MRNTLVLSVSFRLALTTIEKLPMLVMMMMMMMYRVYGDRGLYQCHHRRMTCSRLLFVDTVNCLVFVCRHTLTSNTYPSFQSLALDRSVCSNRPFDVV